MRISETVMSNITDAERLIEAASDFAVLVDRSGSIQDVHLGASFGGEQGSEFLERSWLDTVTVESQEKVEELLREAKEEGVARPRQVNQRLPSGREVPIRYTAVRMGSAGSVLAVGRDQESISHLQQRLIEAQQSLERDYWRMRHLETRYRLLFQASAEAVLFVDSDSLGVVDANAAAGRVLGAPASELVGAEVPLGAGAEDSSAERERFREFLREVEVRGGAEPREFGLGESERVEVSASLLRGEDNPVFLVRLHAPDSESGGEVPGEEGPDVASLVDRLPDALVVTDLEGRILDVNPAFLDLAEISSRERAIGERLDRWVGGAGTGVSVLRSMLETHGSVRLFATSLEGQLGSEREVEVSAVRAPDAEVPALAFVIRDVEKRISTSPEGPAHLGRAVQELTNLVGRVSMKELVADTVGLVERHFIETALEMTGNNRTAAAELLGMSRQSLYTKLDRYDLNGDVGSDTDEAGG